MKCAILFVLCQLVIWSDSLPNTFFPCDCDHHSPLIPGADILASSFDVTEMASLYERQFKSPVFMYTYNNKRCLSYYDVCYRVPDELFPIETNIVMAEAITGLYSSYDEYQHEYSESYTSSTSIGIPDYKMSVDYHSELYDSQEYMTTSYVQQGLGRFRESLYQLDLPPAYIIELDPIFQESLNALPSVIITEDDQIKYNQFLIAYGGYYLTFIEMGGRFDYNQYVNTYWYYSYSEQDTSSNMTASFNSQIFSMEYGHSSNSSEYQVSEAYQENSSINIYCRGGDLSLTCGSKVWRGSIVLDPSYLEFYYAPMNYLVYNNSQKQQTLWNEIYSYTNCACLA